MAEVEGAVTSLSWIPSELLRGPMRLAFDLGLTHYDEPPPDRLTDLDALRRAGRFRFANDLRAWALVEEGRIVEVVPLRGCGGTIGLTNLLGGAVRFPAIQMRDLRTIQIAPDGQSAVVRQTAGGRAPLPAPRLVRGRPRLVPPLVWTTLELRFTPDAVTAHAVGASAFPRHWVYDAGGRLVEKVATTDSTSWLHSLTEDQTPWHGVDEEALTSEVESELERRLSALVMGGQRRIARLEPGETLFRQGEPGGHVALVLDGLVEVVQDGVRLAEIGPGAILGERALLEGTRTADVVAVTDVTVALLDGDRLPRAELEALVEGHRREEA